MLTGAQILECDGYYQPWLDLRGDLWELCWLCANSTISPICGRLCSHQDLQAAYSHLAPLSQIRDCGSSALSLRLSSLYFTPLRPKFNPRTGQRRMCEKFHQLLAVGRWFPPGTPVSSTIKKLISSSSSFHRLDMTLAVAEALNPNKPNHRQTL